MIQKELNQLIDYTLLSQTATANDIEALCREARQHQFRTVCVNPVWVPKAAELLADSEVGVCSVAGFPLGANRTEMKVREAVLAATDGADEIDLVANIGWLLAGEMKLVEHELAEVRRALPDHCLLKVIIEMSQLTGKQTEQACQAVVTAGAEYVKSGTGFLGGVTVQQIEAMVRATAGAVKVKAAGGIRTREFALQLLAAGANRLGCSHRLIVSTSDH